MKLFQEVPANALKQLRKSEARPGKRLDSSALCKEVDTTYAHITKVVNKMENQGLVTRKQEGRSKYIKLTDEGREIAEKITEISEALDNNQGVPA